MASSLNNLANLFAATGDYAGARSLFERVLAIRERGLGPNHERTNSVRYNLAFLFSIQGMENEALDYLNAALDHGFADERLLEDSAFESLYSHPEYKAIVAAVKSRLE